MAYTTDDLRAAQAEYAAAQAAQAKAAAEAQPIQTHLAATRRVAQASQRLYEVQAVLDRNV